MNEVHDDDAGAVDIYSTTSGGIITTTMSVEGGDDNPRAWPVGDSDSPELQSDSHIAAKKKLRRKTRFEKYLLEQRKLRRSYLRSPQARALKETQQRLGTTSKCLPKSRICELTFPHSDLFSDNKMSFVFGRDISPHCLSQRSDLTNVNAKNATVNGSSSSRNAPPQKTSSSTRDRWLFRQSGRYKPLPEARLVHPQGFRILKNCSAVERSLRSYFRLPPAPSTRLEKEHRHAQRQLMTIEAAEDEEEMRFFGATSGGLLSQPRMLLDGFLLLCAGGQPEPEAVETVTLQCSHLIGVIEDDLIHFQNLRFLDLSENEILLEHLLSLSGLEVLHLAYNKITSLKGIVKMLRGRQLSSADANYGGACDDTGDFSQGALRDSASVRSAVAYYAQERRSVVLHTDNAGQCNTSHTREKMYSNTDSPRSDNAGYFSPHQKKTLRFQRTSKCGIHDVLLSKLSTLNLSFNNIPPADILHLSYFPSLEKLDLSGNSLQTLPKDMACLTSVTHLALERNLFRDGNAIFAALSTMPALIEVNLNHNKLRHVPPLSVKNGRGLCFPSIEVVGLGFNCFASVRSVAALSELVRTLKRVVLTGNPIALKRNERSAAQAQFAQAVMNLYWEQAGIREHKGVGSSSFNPFYLNKTPHGNQSPPRTEQNEEEDYHEWGSFINTFQQSSQPETLKNFSHSMRQRSEGGDNDTNTFFEGFNATALAAQAVHAHSGGNSTSENIFWYGDADPLPSHDATASVLARSLRELPTPSGLRFTELVFDETVMQKQKPGYFCSKGRQLAALDAARMSTLVNPKTGLVTVPKYSEFMDIYHILENPPLKRRAFTNRRHVTELERRRRRVPDFVSSYEKRDAKNEENKEQEYTPVDSDKAQDVISMNDSDTDGSLSSFGCCKPSRDAVFMTGVAFQDDHETRQKNRKGKKESQRCALAEKYDDFLGNLSGGNGEPIQSVVENEKDKVHVNTQLGDKKMNQQPNSNDTHSENKKGQCFSSMLTEPPSTNVRILMNELRQMLRRPLPLLPCTSKSKVKCKNVCGK